MHLKALIWTAITLASFLPKAVQPACAAQLTVQTSDDDTGTNAATTYTANTKIPAYTDRTALLIGSTEISANKDNITNGEFQRWYFIDAQTGQMVGNSAQFMDWTTTNWASKGCFYRSEYGLCVYLRSSASTFPGNVRLTLPTGYTSWSEVKLVVLAASSIAGVTAENLTNVNELYTDFKVTSDPTTWTTAYSYSLTDKYPKFQPYEGVVCAKGDFETNADGVQRQHTHSWSYDYYVEPGTTVELKAPIVDDEWIEYGSYWRWYDNNTFKANSRLSTDSKHGSQLVDYFHDDEDRSEGLFYYNNSTAGTRTKWATTASVLYNVPADASWTGDDIAADASRYIDGDGYNSVTLFREPTLSTRFIWHLHPNTEIANNIKQSILGGKAYEDHGNITIALSDKNSGAYSTLRLDLRDVGQYWCYPYRMGVYGKAPTELDFNSQLVQPQSVSWAVHVRNGDKLYYKFLGTGSRFSTSVRYNLYAQDVIGEYVNVNDPNDTWNLDTLKTGREYVIIAYANSLDYSSTNNLTSPIARFNCYFVTQVHPQKAGSVSTHRLVERLEANYTRVGLINFDDEEGMTFDTPTQIYKEGSTSNNSWNHPIAWDKAYYGFVYPQLVAAGKSTIGYTNFGKYGAFHGDYMLVKQAGSKVSPSGGSGDAYRWWYYGSSYNYNELHDRTYELTNGQRSGHFLYVDASDEARPIASLDFEANLCSGSTLILSAAVANLTSESGEKPQLIFKLYGVKYGEDGSIIQRQLIQSFASGDFLSHSANDRAVWYQVFARTFIHPNASAEMFSHFTVTIDNDCSSTTGADYAIDDIRFYVANDQIEVLQQADKEDLCERKNNGAYLKLRMDYSMIRTFLDANERRKPFYYRICTADGTPVKDASLVYPEDKWHGTGTDANGVPYGWVWVEPTEGDNQQYLENDVYGYARFVVANTFFHLDPTKEYYFSGALPIETMKADGSYDYKPGFWGNPGTPCSVYSKILNINQQDFVITSGNGQTVTKAYADCNDEYTTLTLSAKLSIPDAMFGGRKDIDWKFDWVIGGEAAFEHKIKEAGVLDALNHFHAEYPNASDPSHIDASDPDAYTTPWDWFNAMFDDVIELTDIDEYGYYKFNVLQPDKLTDYGTIYPKGSLTVDELVRLEMTAGSNTAAPDAFDERLALLYQVASNRMEVGIHIQREGTVYANIYFIPVEGIYTDPETGIKYRICSDPIPGRLVISHRTPQIYLGFPTVTYPDDYDQSAKYIRLGLKQAEELKKGAVLQIPISHYRDIALNENADRNKLLMEEDNGDNKALPRAIRLVSTNDPTVPEEYIATPPSSQIGNRYFRGKAAEVIEANSTISPNTETIGLDFSKHSETVNILNTDGTVTTEVDNNDITFHEGYDYEFVMTYHDETQTIGEKDEEGQLISPPCFGFTYFTLRIIPEYVTWTGAVSANTNWNNDLNWRRSSRAELNLPFVKAKTAVTDAAGNVKTDGGAASTSDMAENYLEYGCDELAEQEESGLQQYPDATKPESTPQAFVPMKFTKVTINPGTSFPYLGNYEVDARQGIITNLQNPNLSEGTSLIAYDLMVQTEKNASNAYDCERFYANTCQEVYFRTDKTDLPQGEGQIRNQHYLDYKKAWVDLSIHPDQWNWFASPLHDVYAGDFYLPKSTGQQNTEAFQPITFNTATYGRASYPVYQRNWDRKESRVVTQNVDLWPAGWYDAQVPYDAPKDSVELMQSQWSHAYNDMTQRYAPGHGFSLKPELADGSAADTESALFRLPKADTQYDYYDYKDNRPDDSMYSTTADIQRTLPGLLATNRSTTDNPRQLTGSFSVSTAELASHDGYYLVGNPYMGTLQMSSFFNDNPSLYRKYWTLDENGSLKAFAGTDDQLGMVAPMHAFFVKSKAGTNPTEIRFMASQCTTVFYAVGQTASAGRTLQLSVSNARGQQAVAAIKASPTADDDFVDTEDAEMLFDSNLTENGTPQLYTLAGNRAAAINSVSDLRNVPLGFTSAKEEEVEFKVKGVNTLSSPLYLYDAKLRRITPVLEDEPVKVTTNEPGRYLLTSKAMTPASEVKTALRCYSTGEQGGVVASTDPEDRLTQIQVYDTLGRLQRELTPGESVHRFFLPKGLYLITVSSDAVSEGRTFKVMVK